jgi:ParB family chromosome partitioning protein
MNRGMGRGLAAILPQAGEASEPGLREIPVSMIQANPKQPRRRFDAASIKSLAASIADAGLIQPVSVRALPDGRFELIAGERRWRAAQEANLETIPAMIRDEDEVRRLQTALIENVVREDLNPVEEARACSTLIDELGVSKEELARRLGRSRPALSNLIRILDLPDEALELLESGVISEGHGRAILLASGEDARLGLARAAAKGGWSVRETERRAKAGETGPRQPKAELHPDEVASLAEAEEALETALGHGVKIKKMRSGIRAELHFDDLDALADFTKRPPR